MMGKKEFAIIIFTYCLYPAAAQVFRAEEWGELANADLEMTAYPQDSAAEAVVLQDIGSAEIKFMNGQWQLLHTRHRRIKILDEKAFEQGNLKIEYGENTDVEKLKDVDVLLHFPNGEKQKIKSRQFLTEKVGPYRKAKKIFIPNLKKGCIIEYRYEMILDHYISLIDWYFQEDIPVRWSELRLVIPEHFEFIYLLNAPRNLDLHKTDTLSKRGSYKILHITMGLSNLPAIKEEPYITTLEDYRAGIRFQLSKSSFLFFSSTVLSDWREVAVSLELSPFFGAKYKFEEFYKKAWDAFRLMADSIPREALPEEIMRFVARNVKWNGQFRYIPSDILDVVFSEKAGSSADINILVTALLLKAGFEAKPVLVSTRTHGKTWQKHPFLSQFNSVVAALKIGEQITLIDATSPFHSFGELHPLHYNGAGWMVDGIAPLWIDIKPPEISNTWLGEIFIDSTGIMKGHFTAAYGGPAASQWRETLNTEEPEEYLPENFAASFPDIRFDSIKIQSSTEINSPFGIEFDFSLGSSIHVSDDFIYCKPVLHFIPNGNPFKALKREFPVDFTYPFKSNYVINLHIPKGYAIEELPPSARIILEDNGGKIQFNCKQSGPETIQLNLKVNIGKLTFLPGEYQALRKFFNLIDDKMQMQLVLKKN